MMHVTSGKHNSTAFAQYGFYAGKDNGRLIAICRFCHRKLQNTAAARLRGHRNICSPADSHVLPDYPQRGLSRGSQGVQPPAKVCKTEMDEYSEDSMHFEDDNDSAEKDQQQISQQQVSKNTNEDIHLYDDDEANPLSPINNNSADNDIDDIILEEDDVLEPKVEYVKRQRSTRRSEKLIALHEEKAKAETIYFQKKAEYFKKQTENLDIQRKLMILQAQKLRLEIENIRNDY